MILVAPSAGLGRCRSIQPGCATRIWAGRCRPLAGPVSNVLVGHDRGRRRRHCANSRPRSRDSCRRVHQPELGLAVFNLVPLPPLDGFGFVFGLAPRPVKAALLPLQQLRAVSCWRSAVLARASARLPAYPEQRAERRDRLPGQPAGRVYRAINRVAHSRHWPDRLIIGLALKAARPQTQIVGYDASGENLRRAQGVKAIDRRGSLRDALGDADLVIVSIPVGVDEGAVRGDGAAAAGRCPGHGYGQHQGARAAVGGRTAAERACDSSAATRWPGRPRPGQMRPRRSFSRARCGAWRRCRRAAGRHRRCGPAGRDAGRVAVLPRSRRARWAGGVRQPPAVPDVGRR